MRKYRSSRPRKRTRENANAAMLESRTVTIVTTVDTSALLKYQRQMSPLDNTASNASKVISEPNHLAGASVVSASGLSAVASAHASGISHTIANSSAMTNAAMLAGLLRPRVIG